MCIIKNEIVIVIMMMMIVYMTLDFKIVLVLPGLDLVIDTKFSSNF